MLLPLIRRWIFRQVDLFAFGPSIFVFEIVNVPVDGYRKRFRRI